jgi:RNA-directed DNA polymerase
VADHLAKYFDTIPRQDLMPSVAWRIVDRHVLQLIKLWLKTSVEEVDDDRKRRLTGGQEQFLWHAAGWVISSLLANRCVNRFLTHWACI